MLKLILEFYLTLAIPLSYGFGLWLIWRSWDQASLSGPAVISGVVLSLSGLFLWFMSYRALGSAFGVLPQVQKVVNRGLYRWLRHPMYLGIFLTFLGLSLAVGSRSGLVYCFGYLTPLLLIRARSEERRLVKD